MVDAFTETAQGALRRREPGADWFRTFTTGKRALVSGAPPPGEKIKIRREPVKFRAGAGLKKAVNKK